jgi:2',3'-cyclic-nucleotide 2'-phosphodiesterase (5'-nucleotidase family)
MKAKDFFMKSRYGFVMLFAIYNLLFWGCNDDDHVESRLPDLPTQQIVVLYDNDVHCTVDGYPMFVTARNECLSRTNYVSTVSSGDFSSGGFVGAVSKGEQIVELMNYVGYDVVALGNHELDYGMPQMFKLTDALDAPVVCANFKNVQTGAYPYPAYKIIRYGEVDVAYIGFTTTTTGTVTSLCDEQGNPLYSFMRENFYENAQYFINKARQEGADYVIALAHLGDTPKTGGHANSMELISSTTGLDAVIDAHDHHVIEQQFVNNKEGRPVLLTSSGTNFQYIGQLTINTDGTLESSLINTFDDAVAADSDCQQFVEQLKEKVSENGDFVVGSSEVDLTIYDADGKRIVRKQESNLGDFCTDTLRTFTGADIALVNGGGIRTDIKRGDILFNDLINVMPFGDMIATGILSGEQLLDVLEYSVSALPAESGTFMQVSGLRFKINQEIPSPAIKDEAAGMFTSIGEGERRISQVEVLDKQSNVYQPLDKTQQYTIATLDYLILELGGSGILSCVTPDFKYYGADIEILRHYLETNLGSVIGAEYSQPQGRISIE